MGYLQGEQSADSKFSSPHVQPIYSEVFGVPE